MCIKVIDGVKRGKATISSRVQRKRKSGSKKVQIKKGNQRQKTIIVIEKIKNIDN